MRPGEEPRRTLVKLQLEVGTDPIRGEISDSGGRRQAFVGWLELIGTLERIHGLGRVAPREPHSS